jgi:alpha-beta hydrolase superfamily lysophospholipase
VSSAGRQHEHRSARVGESRAREELGGAQGLPSDPGQRAAVRPLYLDVRGEPVFGLLHPAEGHGPGVLFCSPFGWEDVASYRSRFEWAQSLAEAGMPTLRFDLPGTGDSAGSAEDPGRLESWVEAVGVAARFLQGEVRRPRMAAIGIGVGGLLALAAVADGAPLDDLVLWGVPARGKALVRELAAFARIEAALIVAGGAPVPPPLSSGAIAPGGFLLPAGTMQSLERLDVADLNLSGWERRRALVLGRDGIAPDPALLRELRERGLEVDVADGYGYGAMLTETPEATRLPHAVRDCVREWLQAPAPDVASARIVAPSIPRGMSAEAEIAVGETRLRETPLAVVHEGGRLFGILSERMDSPPGELALVLLNAGAIRRVGPSRLWVALGRQWAARGVPTFRLDLDGIGDASGDSHRYVDVAGLYAREYVHQVRAVLDDLVERGTAQRFALFGLCAGAYWAFHTALVDDRVSLAVMLNPRLLFWDSDAVTARRTRGLRRNVLRVDSWQRALQGDRRLVARRLLSSARLVATEPLRYRARQRAHGESRAATETAFEQLSARSARAVFLFTGGEPLVDELGAAGIPARADRWPGVEFVELPGRDHTLRPVWMHEHVHAAVDGALESELRRSDLAPQTHSTV